MDSDDDLVYEEDEESMEDESADEDFIDIGMEPEPSSKEHHDQEEFPYEVLTADMIVHFMVESIKEVNTVVQVCTFTKITGAKPVDLHENVECVQSKYE